MAPTILLTGFGPFPGAPRNPTGALVRKLARLRRPALADMRLVAHVFPTSYRSVDAELPRLLSELKPDVLLMFGLSQRARSLRVETRARNAVSALIPDAEGHQRRTTCILAGGPAAIAFRAPALWLAMAAGKVGTRAQTSRDAGRYLCNYLCWRAIEAAARPGGPKLAAFIHVPKLAETVRPRRPNRAAVWRLRDLLRGSEAILLAAAAAARQRMNER